MLTVTVAQDGSGDFASIAEAVLAVPYEEEALVQVGPGIYREKLVCEKRCITLRGVGADKTKLVWGDGGSLKASSVWDIENDTPDKRLSVALMKRFIPKTATEVASNAMQILGGLGYTEGSRVSSIWEDCRGNQIAQGTDQIMVYISAPLILDKYEKEEAL